MHKIGICGSGFVGNAVESGLQSVAEIRVYDKYKPSESLYDVVNNSDILFVCVPTPMEDDGWCDTSIVGQVCIDIDKNAEERKSIVIKSTVPPGTTQEISKYLGERHGCMFNPEFLREKTFIQDFLEQDRIIIGPSNECLKSDIDKVLELYKSFAKTQKNPATIKITPSANVAEMVKYATNCYLATKVLFFNEMYDICKSIDIDFEDMKQLMLLDKRISSSHTQVPGHDGLRGFGGACFYKDMSALIAFCQEEDIDVTMLESVMTKNLMIRENYDWEKLAQVNGQYEEG